jgi:hypothetical protein
MGFVSDRLNPGAQKGAQQNCSSCALFQNARRALTRVVALAVSGLCF